MAYTQEKASDCSECPFWVVNTTKTHEKHRRNHQVSRRILYSKGADNSTPSSPFADHTDSRTPFSVVFVCTTPAQTKVTTSADKILT